MKNVMTILVIIFFALILCTACTTVVDNKQPTESSDIIENEQSVEDSNITENGQAVEDPDRSEPISLPDFFNDIGKTLSTLENEHLEGEIFVSFDAFSDAYAACFGEPEAPYAYLFFGGHSGDFEKAMNECEEQLKCAGFVTTAGVLFPEMEDDMAFSDFFSLIGVSDYTYFAKEDNTTAQGWLEFTYNDMDVWLDANDPTVGYWEFTDVDRVKSSAPVSIVDEELDQQNHELAESVMFE